MRGSSGLEYHLAPDLAQSAGQLGPAARDNAHDFALDPLVALPRGQLDPVAVHGRTAVFGRHERRFAVRVEGHETVAGGVDRDATDGAGWLARSGRRFVGLDAVADAVFAVVRSLERVAAPADPLDDLVVDQLAQGLAKFVLLFLVHAEQLGDVGRPQSRGRRLPEHREHLSPAGSLNFSHIFLDSYLFRDAFNEVLIELRT